MGTRITHFVDVFMVEPDSKAFKNLSGNRSKKSAKSEWNLIALRDDFVAQSGNA